MVLSVLCRDVAAASSILRVLGNPTRLAIACLLVEGERSVSEIERCLDIHQPTLSQQVGVLRNAGIIKGRRQAKHVVYGVSDQRARAVILSLRSMWPDLIPAQARLIDSKTTAQEATSLHVETQLSDLEIM